MKNTCIVFALTIIFSFFLAQPVLAQVVSCVTNTTEDHPLRPYPGEICGPNASPDEPYCASKPWAVEVFDYLRNIQGCDEGDPVYPCVQALDSQEGCEDNPNNLPCIAGDYSIDLSQYELPLVSVNRPGFSDLTFFNRAQEHTADYFEGRSYYEGVVEPSLSDFDPINFSNVWTRLGVFRKLTSYFQQNELKLDNLERARSGADQSIHNYIVSYRSGQEPSNWGVGDPVRMTNFIGYEPPTNDCRSLTDPNERDACYEEFFADLEVWNNTVYGKLWAYVPMTSREDAFGSVTMNPDPNVDQPRTAITNQVSLPHLKRLDFISSFLNQSLSSLARETDEPLEEQEADMGGSCPAGPWDFCPSYTLGCGTGSCYCEDPDALANCPNPDTDASDPCVRDRAFVADLATRWISGETGNQVSRCYADVVNSANAVGFDPALAMIIWLNESNASNYHLSCWDFGVLDESKKCNFTDQIQAFLNLPGYYQGWSQCFNPTPIDPNTGERFTEVETFLAIFAAGNCDPSDWGYGYAKYILNQVYGWVSTCEPPTSL
jgi:hypothetical protein